jgi:hypothetical protein
LKLNNLIGRLPGYWCLFEALDLSLLRSKEPTFLGLYSAPKTFAILLLLFMGFLALRFISPIIAKVLNEIPFKDKLTNISSFKIFFVLAVFFRIIVISSPCSVGEDIAPQVLSCKQWIEGGSIAPNMLASPEWTDLTFDQQNWMLRPPGGAWIPLPGLLLGFSIGNSIHLSLFILCLAAGAGWLRLGKVLELPKTSLQLLAFLLAMTSSWGSLSLSTASVFTSATFPWLLIWSLHLGQQWNLSDRSFKIHLLSLLFFLTIGIHAFFKLSSLLTVSAIALIPFVIHFAKSKRIQTITFGRVMAGMLLFLLPYFLVNELNQNFTGISADKLYTQQDYNAQHELWGTHFTESTQGGMLVTSLLASTGYATPAQCFAHGFRDLLMQFENYKSILFSLGINPRIMGCSIFAIPITLILFIGLWKIRPFVSNRQTVLFSTLFIVPFIGFAFISHHHGYNYLIYPSYTKEFAMIFLIFGLSYFACSNKIIKHQLIGNLLLAFLIALPIISSSKVFCRAVKNSFCHSLPSQYEHQQNLGKSKFSKSLKRIENDSNSSFDICLFLCSGDQGDSILRTPKRTLSLHFAKGKLTHLPSLHSSRPLNMYCLVDPLLANDTFFVQSVLDKFPTTALKTQLDSSTWKVAFGKP